MIVYKTTAPLSDGAVDAFVDEIAQEVEGHVREGLLENNPGDIARVAMNRLIDRLHAGVSIETINLRWPRTGMGKGR